jgi:hypothetical protein
MAVFCRARDRERRLELAASPGTRDVGGLYLLAAGWFANGVAWSLLALYFLGHLR